MIKKILGVLLITSLVCSPVFAERITLQDGFGNEVGTAGNPLVVSGGSSGGVPSGAVDGDIPFVSSGAYDSETTLSWNTSTQILTAGGTTIGGTGEYIESTRSGIDFDAVVGGLDFYAKGGTNNEHFSVDLEQYSNRALFSTTTGLNWWQIPWDVSPYRVTYGPVDNSPSLVSSAELFLKLEENAANTTMTDASANTLTCTPSTNTSAFTTTGKLNNGFIFASNRTVDCGTSAELKQTGAFSVAMWIKTTSANNDIVAGNRSSSSPNPGWQFILNSTARKISWQVDTGASIATVTSSTSVNTDVWFFVVGVYDGAQTRLYIDGVSEGTPASLTGDAGTNAGNTFLAKSPVNATLYYDGSIDNFQVFNKALSTDDLATLYNSGTGTDSLGASSAGGPSTIAADDTTPDVSNNKYFVTSANTGATAISDLDNPKAGSEVCIIGGSATNSSTIADSGNFNLSASFTAGLDDVLCLYVVADNDYVEISRVDN